LFSVTLLPGALSAAASEVFGNGALAGVVAGHTATFYVQGYDALSPKNSAPLPAVGTEGYCSSRHRMSF